MRLKFLSEDYTNIATLSSGLSRKLEALSEFIDDSRDIDAYQQIFNKNTEQIFSLLETTRKNLMDFKLAIGFKQNKAAANPGYSNNPYEIEI